MSKKVHEFNDMIRKLRKELFGKGPERIHTVFAENMAIATLYGNLTPTEKFISSTMDGAEMVHMARTKMIQEVYAANSREQLAAVLKKAFRLRTSSITTFDDVEKNYWATDAIS
ncbi:DUF2294 domain-containing protein, partial [Bacillus sp. D-CC]